MSLKIIKSFILLSFVLKLIVGCAPIYKTIYHYQPPKHSEGMICANTCLLQRGQCEISCNSIEKACINSADWTKIQSYRDISDKELIQKIEKNNCNKLCTNNYNICYQACGGTVIVDQDCTDFCK